MNSMRGPTRTITFLLSTVSGVLVALICFQYDALLSENDSRTTPQSYELRSPGYTSWLSNSHVGRRSPPADGKPSEADFLYREVPVLCLVQARSRQQTRAVSNTWSQHCNDVVFFGSLRDPYIRIRQVPVHATDAKVLYDLLKHVLIRYGGLFRWILLADDETFAVVENLRLYVAALNASEVYYLGHPFQESDGFYNALTAGIALSEGAVRVLWERTRGRPLGKTSLPMDRYIGSLLRDAIPVDTRDAFRRGRFNPFSVEKMIVPGSISYFNSYWRSSLFLSQEVRGEGGSISSIFLNDSITSLFPPLYTQVWF